MLQINIFQSLIPKNHNWVLSLLMPQAYQQQQIMYITIPIVFMILYLQHYQCQPV